ncbi:MAG: hypothetical protein UW82_C0029G0004 [candidate division WWE3 bacterium GW2011_GWC2_44_9]|uniref:DUF998 domain-containing protein n=1 Tax=candidate division WWE3 bacterium GW2011_GWC2_44_9 TaxID=1619125 RepID=A0A0G1MT58_UNCKA|nr:MAG: hypothetical protein US38_C0005G0058 [Candidatus Roizmanbacteria bacterium GW2011_GWC1_37_12]KKT83967.1 MAG: hypothetical protein UW82_C0029G0004 [candidate division WWE3 bacterium GW2011_GWC2_44_9]
MENRQTRLKIFKYNAILSILFFLSSTFYLSGQIENYSFSKYTISAMSRFLTEDKLSYFNAVFFIKSFLDLSFTFYVFKYFRLYVFSPTAVSWLIAVLSFGLLGFFPAHQFKEIHLAIVYVLFFFWTISEFLFAKLTKNEGFQFLTNNLLLIQIITIFLFVLTNNFNAIFEIFYLFLIFFWLIVFISRHLK